MILCQLPPATVKYFKKGQRGSIRIGHKTGEALTSLTASDGLASPVSY